MLTHRTISGTVTNKVLFLRPKKVGQRNSKIRVGESCNTRFHERVGNSSLIWGWKVNNSQRMTYDVSAAGVIHVTEGEFSVARLQKALRLLHTHYSF